MCARSCLLDSYVCVGGCGDLVITRLWPSGNEVDNNREDVDSNLNRVYEPRKAVERAT